MRNNKIFGLGLGIFLSITLGFAAPASAKVEKRFITIGTASQTGVYYAVGNAVCRLVNKKTKEHGVRCTAESTGGSIYNLNAIAKKPKPELDFAVAQSDWQFHAFNGSKVFKDAGPNSDLRAVFSVHAEPFTVLARRDAGIKSIDDLKGKRVNIGNPGSGPRATFEVIMKAKGWTKKDFKYVAELKGTERGSALCDNKVDAVLYTVGHPNGMMQEATSTCDAVLVEVAGPAVDKLIGDNPFYAAAVVPGGLYRGNPDPVKTFGVKATFVSSAKIPANTVYTLVSTIFNNFSVFKRLHPAFHHLDPKDMVTAGNSAPLHDGSTKYFAEKGWLAASTSTPDRAATKAKTDTKTKAKKK